jgi:hypothetical protein
MECARADELELVLARSAAEKEAEATRVALEMRGLREELAELTKAAEKASKLAAAQLAAQLAEQLLVKELREEEEAAQSRLLEVALLKKPMRSSRCGRSTPTRLTPRNCAKTAPTRRRSIFSRPSSNLSSPSAGGIS